MTTRRLALLNGLALLATASLFAWALVAIRGYGLSQVLDARLRARAETVQAAGLLPSQTVLSDLEPFGMPPIYLQVVDANGVVIARSANLAERELPMSAEQRRRALDGEASYATLPVEAGMLRDYVLPRVARTGLIESAAPLDEALALNRQVIIVSAIGGLLLALVVGWALARLALKPIEYLAVTVRAVSSTEDLGRRVPPDLTARRDAVGGLARDVDAMLARLRSAAQQVQGALDAQRRFVADASHELRTPLTSIRGNVHLMARWFAEQQPRAASAPIQDVLHDVTLEVDRMARLVDGLLVLARADADQRLLLRPTQLGSVLEAACRAGQPLVDEVEFSVGSLASDVWVQADADRLHQLVLILLDNAVRYTPAGGRVTLSAAPAARAERAGVVIEVQDSGRGIPAAERARIFERFYRSETALDRRGSGLGLAVARWIVSEHQGDIDVREALPSGSIFSVWLPTIPAPSAGCSPSAQAEKKRAE